MSSAVTSLTAWGERERRARDGPRQHQRCAWSGSQGRGSPFAGAPLPGRCPGRTGPRHPARAAPATGAGGCTRSCEWPGTRWTPSRVDEPGSSALTCVGVRAGRGRTVGPRYESRAPRKRTGPPHVRAGGNRAPYLAMDAANWAPWICEGRPMSSTGSGRSTRSSAVRKSPVYMFPSGIYRVQLSLGRKREGPRWMHDHLATEAGREVATAAAAGGTRLWESP